MLKKYLLVAVFTLSVCAANADMQSPFGADRQMNMQAAQNQAINDAEMDIMDVIKEKPVVPAGSHKSSFSAEKGKMDASSFYGQGGTNIPAGVNDSKTIYTDDLGRLHFFGKGNIIKE